MPNFNPVIHPWNQQIWQDLTSEQERKTHALLFSGLSGLGKADLAQAYAHYILTDNDHQSEQLFQAGSHPDFHVLMAEDKIADDLVGEVARRYIETHTGKAKKIITIEQVRRLNAAITTHPHIAQSKVILILDADKMNVNAANALLKSLEEPPSQTLFLLVSDEKETLPKTIISRCNILNFRIPEQNAAKAWLSHQQGFGGDSSNGNSSNDSSSNGNNNEPANFLAMAGGRPLAAVNMLETDYIGQLKTIFTQVNALWGRQQNAVAVAKNWQTAGGAGVVLVIQKLLADLLRCHFSAKPAELYYPVQKSWLDKMTQHMPVDGLFKVWDKTHEIQKMISSPVDELLLLEDLAISVGNLVK